MPRCVECDLKIPRGKLCDLCTPAAMEAVKRKGWAARENAAGGAQKGSTQQPKTNGAKRKLPKNIKVSQLPPRIKDRKPQKVGLELCAKAGPYHVIYWDGRKRKWVAWRTFLPYRNAQKCRNALARAGRKGKITKTLPEEN